MTRVAILLANYNMPERTDALCDKITSTVRGVDYDLIVVDNGSDLQEPSRYTTLRMAENVQTTGAWLMGLHYADQLALKHGSRYGYYWFLITSAELPLDTDPLTPMVDWMESHYDAVGIHPALTEDSTTSWTHLITRGGREPRQTWMIDNIASLYSAGWFDQIGRFDPLMRYAWGIDLETCYKARMQERSLWVDERVRVRKITNIGYTMNRMNMTAEQRSQRAGQNMTDILSRKYGQFFWQKMTEEGVKPEWK